MENGTEPDIVSQNEVNLLWTKWFWLMSVFRGLDILPVIFMIEEIAWFWWNMITCESPKTAIRMQIAEWCLQYKNHLTFQAFIVTADIFSSLVS